MLLSRRAGDLSEHHPRLPHVPHKPKPNYPPVVLVKDNSNVSHRGITCLNHSILFLPYMGWAFFLQSKNSCALPVHVNTS